MSAFRDCGEFGEHGAYGGRGRICGASVGSVAVVASVACVASVAVVASVLRGCMGRTGRTESLRIHSPHPHELPISAPPSIRGDPLGFSSPNYKHCAEVGFFIKISFTPKKKV